MRRDWAAASGRAPPTQAPDDRRKAEGQALRGQERPFDCDLRGRQQSTSDCRDDQSAEGNQECMHRCQASVMMCPIVIDGSAATGAEADVRDCRERQRHGFHRRVPVHARMPRGWSRCCGVPLVPPTRCNMVVAHWSCYRRDRPRIWAKTEQMTRLIARRGGSGRIAGARGRTWRSRAFIRTSRSVRGTR